MPAPDSVLTLVERFREHRDEYLSAGYNEATLRREFLEPMFKALGWDVDNTKGYAEAYKEVVHEDAIKISGATKAPDYAFRLGGARKFFVEAKKPSVDVKGDPSPAYQLRRYAWSAKLPLSILTDFHEFAVYDCTKKPDPTDTAATCRILYLTCDDYAKRWEEIAELFSPEAIQKGAFDKHAASAKKKGTTTVDDAFLKEIETWRDLLAHNLALRNPGLTQRELNTAVQTTIDRIIFLRICEDRGIEEYGVLRGLVNGTCIYGRMLGVFHAADERYNSGLFHFRSEKDRPGEPDTLTLGLVIDDKALKEILDALYYPKSPYEFSVLPADILGHVYEQFLGKVIRLTAGHHAVVEEKPEVKKAGGVYYTPTYIVDYIVKNTVGKLLEGMTPKEAGSLRILDPACGSGSFLLGAYQLLLDWHQAWYAGHDPERWARGRGPRIFRGQDAEWRLTTAERKRVLLDCIYGVDIDPQAVEVTKLSLLLKVLEGEDAESIGKTLSLLRERALPDLGKNIQCGNSLIGTDFYDEHLIDTLTEEERYRINAFDWEAAFPEVLKAGGFDAVVGNPPYGAGFTAYEKKYLFAKYPLIKGQPESYEYFLLRAMFLTKRDGLLSLITPTNFAESQRAEGLRRALLREGLFVSVADLRYPVWKNAAETLIFVHSRGRQTGSTAIAHPTNPEELAKGGHPTFVRQSEWGTLPGARFLLRARPSLIRRLEERCVRLGEVCDVSQGIIVYKTRIEGAENRHISAEVRGGENWKKLLDTSSTVGRYRLEWGGRYLNYGDWLWCPRDARFFEEPKILFVRLRNKALARKLVGVYDEERFYNRDNFNNIVAQDPAYPLLYILALFNSALLNYWYKAHFDNVNINPAQVRLLPIARAGNKGLTSDVEVEQLAVRAGEMQHMYSGLNLCKTDQERTVLQRQIDATDRQVDQLVYELYGLTDEEVRIVEETTRV